jgi:TRAP-type mannitol/chloroaromatic compound transport system permease small subunit
MLKRLAAAIDAFGTLLGRAVSYLIFVMIAIIAIEVVARYFFNQPTRWVQDVSGWLQVAYVFLGAAFALKHGYLVRVDVAFMHFGARGRALVDLTVSTVLFVCFAAVLIWKGFEFGYASYRMGEVSPSAMWAGPVYPSKFFVPIGMVLLSLAWVAHLCRQMLVLLGEPPESAETERGAGG